MLVIKEWLRHSCELQILNPFFKVMVLVYAYTNSITFKIVTTFLIVALIVAISIAKNVMF